MDTTQRPWWKGLKSSDYQRRRRQGFDRKSAQRFILIGILWIFGSPDCLLTNRGVSRSSVPLARFVAAHSTDRSSSTSLEESAACDGRQLPRPGAIYSAVGHLDYGVGLELRADIPIPGSCEVNLPIDVRVNTHQSPKRLSFVSFAGSTRLSTSDQRVRISLGRCW